MLSCVQPLSVLVAFPIFISATVLLRQFGSDIVSGCNTGPIQCCTKVESVATSPYSDIVGCLLGVAVDSLAGLIETNGSTIDVVGLGGGNSCNVQPFCCTGTQFMSCPSSSLSYRARLSVIPRAQNSFISFGCNSVTINI